MLFVPKDFFLVRTFIPDKQRWVSIKIYNSREERKNAYRKTEHLVAKAFDRYVSK